MSSCGGRDPIDAKRPREMRDRVYTTMDLARVCRVSLRTVIRWVDDGILPSFRTPGGHRRVREEDLERFLERYHIPVAETFRPHTRTILVVGPCRTVSDPWMRSLSQGLGRVLRRASDACAVLPAKDFYEAALLLGIHRPDLIILDAGKTGIEVVKFCRAVRSLPETRQIRILLLDPGMPPARRRELQALSVEAMVSRPCTVEDLRAHLLPLLGFAPSARSTA